MGKKSQKSAQKPQKSVLSSWVDSTYSSTLSVFSRNNSFDKAFLEFDPSYDWGFVIHAENYRIYCEYGDCTIPFYECIFSVFHFL